MIENRETYLTDAIGIIRRRFEANGYSVPAVKVSTGLPFQRSGSKNALKVIGQFWSPKASDDSIGSVFISPTIANTVEVLATLVHELVHAVVGVENGHNAVFKRCATAVGLTGKMRATVAGEDLKIWMNSEVISIIGEYPHAKLNPSFRPGKKQSTRMIKMSCPECGYIVRASRTAIEEHGPVICPCNSEPMKTV